MLKKLSGIIIVIIIITLFFFLYNGFINKNSEHPELNPFKEHSIEESEIGDV